LKEVAVGITATVKGKDMAGISAVRESSILQQDRVDSPDNKGPVKAADSRFDSQRFESFIKSKLGSGSAGQVSEEELFSVIIAERIDSLKGAEAAAQYDKILARHRADLSTLRSDGVFSHEDAAVGALEELKSASLLTPEEADKIYAESFKAAQLDDNHDVLWDDRGGPGDPTMAVADLASAMKRAKVALEKIASGELTADSKALGAGSGSGISVTPFKPGAGGTGERISPNGTDFDGANGFLFKPVSENQGTLAVLLPEANKGLVTGVTLRDLEGNILEDGISMGYGEEGTREKFSFKKKGGDYPPELLVHVQFMDGTNSEYYIPDPSKRYD
jgi:hypothetical protein